MILTSNAFRNAILTLACSNVPHENSGNMRTVNWVFALFLALCFAYHSLYQGRGFQPLTCGYHGTVKWFSLIFSPFNVPLNPIQFTRWSDNSHIVYVLIFTLILVFKFIWTLWIFYMRTENVMQCQLWFIALINLHMLSHVRLC